MENQENHGTLTASYTELDKNDMDCLWEKSLELLEAHPDITESRFRSLFLRMSPVSFNDAGIFSLGVPNKFNQRLVEKTCLPPIIETLRQVSERDDLEVIIEVDESVPSTYSVAPLPTELNPINPITAIGESITSIASHSSATANQMANQTNNYQEQTITNTTTATASRKTFNPFDDLELDQNFVFSSFVVGDSNNFAYSSALAVAESPGFDYNPLFIWGSSGLGKTHLLHAIGIHVAEMYPEKKIVCTTAKNFVDQYVRNTAGSAGRLDKVSGIEKMRSHYRSADVLLIDDIQDLKGEQSTNQFFHTFNHLKSERKQIVLVADRSPEELKLDERLTSRFKSGLMVDIQPPTYEMRCAILKNYIKKMGVPYSNESIDYIAEKSSDNIREMESAIIRVNAWVTLSKKSTADIDTVKKVLIDYFPEKEDRPISISSIQKEVCRFYNVTHTELVGTKRKQEIVFPRHVAMFLCAELTDSSTPQIGKAFGGKDHTTVMHAVDKIKKKMSTENEILDQIQHLTKILRNKTM